MTSDSFTPGCSHFVLGPELLIDPTRNFGEQVCRVGISHLCGMVYGHNAAEVHRELPLELVVLLSGLSIEPVTQTKLQARERLTVPNQPLTAPTIHLAGSRLSLL